MKLNTVDEINTTTNMIQGAFQAGIEKGVPTTNIAISIAVGVFAILAELTKQVAGLREEYERVNKENHRP